MALTFTLLAVEEQSCTWQQHVNLLNVLCLVPGSLGAARNLQALQGEGITHVLNASPIVPCFHRRHLRYKVITVYDDAQEDIASHFDTTNRYIAKVRSLIALALCFQRLADCSCLAGSSRFLHIALLHCAGQEEGRGAGTLLCRNVALSHVCSRLSHGL